MSSKHCASWRASRPGATGFTADKVGIMGFSAGGHLAATASTLGAFKPAFAILVYPVITAEPGKGHQFSFDNLLGEDRTAEQSEYYSLQNRVTEATPPTLLFHSDDDTGVPPVNSALYYEALKAHGVKASLHIYPMGEHGWGIPHDLSLPRNLEGRRAGLAAGDQPIGQDGRGVP